MSGPVTRNRETWIRHLLADRAVPAGARLAGLVIAVYVDDSGGQGVYLTANDVAHLAGIAAIATVREWLDMLQRLGWLVTDGQVRYLGWPSRFSAAGAPDTPEPFEVRREHVFVTPADDSGGCLECGAPAAVHPGGAAWSAACGEAAAAAVAASS